MSRDRSSPEQQLLEQMGRAVVPVDEPERQEQLRRKLVPRLQNLHQQTLAESKRRERRQRWFGVAAVAAAPLLAAGAYYGWRKPLQVETTISPAAELQSEMGEVFVERAGLRTDASGRRLALGDGDQIVTGPHGRATVTLSGCASIDVAPATRLALQSKMSLGLTVGRVIVQVDKLLANERFEVRTADATVEVHGTRFSLDKDTTRTVVDVFEGRVLVQQGSQRTYLAAGQHWSSLPDAPVVAPASDSSDSSSSKAADDAKASSVVTRAARAASPVSGEGSPESRAQEAAIAESSLAEQNRLFQAGMNARRSGNAGRAMALFGELLSAYPNSPLAENARVERFRALSQLGHAEEAAREARRYLALYPQGFARQEARRLVLGSETAPE